MFGDFDKDLLRGEEYQRFITDKLGVLFYNTKQEQLTIGESPLGLEVKFDDRSTKTGNYFIEVCARANKNSSWIAGGVMKKDNAWCYLMGDYDKAVLFYKQDLQSIWRELKVNKTGEFKVIVRDTFAGYLLPKEVAQQKALKIFNFK